MESSSNAAVKAATSCFSESSVSPSVTLDQPSAQAKACSISASSSGTCSDSFWREVGGFTLLLPTEGRSISRELNLLSSKAIKPSKVESLGEVRARRDSLFSRPAKAAARKDGRASCMVASCVPESCMLQSCISQSCMLTSGMPDCMAASAME
jgi:hypothetical protein